MALLPGAAPLVVPRPLPAWVQAAQQAAAEPPKPKIRTGQHQRAPFATYREIANRLSEDVTNAWFKARGGSQGTVAIGVVAALSLMAPADPSGPDLGDEILALNPDELAEMLREIWGFTWFREPFLIERARPLHDWLHEEETDPDLVYAAHKVARAAIQSGLLDVTGHKDPGLRADVDVLSRLVMAMNGIAKRRADGEFHTPEPVCDLMASIIIGDRAIEPGMSLLDPAAGSGQMLRAAASHIRDRGQNPANLHWYANDIDEVAVACCAVNSIVWGLGPNVVIAKADSLAEPDWPTRARSERAEIIAHRNRVFQQATTEAAHRKALRLLTNLTQPQGEAA
ncbi:N-6 DNA methylase [Kitasatospora purpeofusca]|uniref:N-6 DNA methylase n=1 Tax=Kitasatospora purpeofusca TaxID=67352 RepID=UPI0036E16289